MRTGVVSTDWAESETANERDVMNRKHFVLIGAQTSAGLPSIRIDDSDKQNITSESVGSHSSILLCLLTEHLVVSMQSSTGLDGSTARRYFAC